MAGDWEKKKKMKKKKKGKKGRRLARRERERERIFRCPPDGSEKEGISRLDVADWSSRW